MFLFFDYAPVCSQDLGSLKGYHGAFVIPLVHKNNKTYVMVGCESGGKDKGSYCVPGGSSGWWIFRDTDPLKTAVREFCEETLTSVDYYAIRALIEGCPTVITHANGKKIVSYTVFFKEKTIDDIIKNFQSRRSRTWFWQYYYQEMDHFVLIEWDKVLNFVKNPTLPEQRHQIPALMFDHNKAAYVATTVSLRPILILMLQG